MTKDVSLARSAPPLVGREHELQRLTQRLRSPRPDAIEVLLIAGEPGVGKTRLMQEAVTVAGDLGWLTLVGHAYDTEGMPPYLPFIEALQEYASASRPEELEARLAEAGPEVALLVPALGRQHVEPPSTQSDPETQRYRLFESVCDFLLKTAGPGSPYAGLLLCLDDLHWADESTLLLLEHLTRKQTSAPVVILATYRDTELDVSRPLARTLEQLTRLGVASRIDLKRLDRVRLSALLAALGGPNPPTVFIDTVFNETEGNPFFVREVFEYLKEAGRLLDAEGAWRTDVRVTDTDVPQGVRLVISRRLERLSGECRQVLALAAVVGRSFSYELLRTVADVSEDHLLGIVEEAEHANMLTSDTSGQVTFAHELIRQTLLSNLSSLRRQRLHLSAALAMEKLFSGRPDLHSSDLADHFLQAGGEATNLQKAVQYAELAAQRATSVYAYGEAARSLEKAVEAQEMLDPDDKPKRCDLMLALSAALMPAGENQRVLDEVVPQAYSLAESLNERRRMGAVALAALDAATRLWGPAGVAAAQGSMWLERADQCTDAETKERVIVDGRRAARLQEQGLAGQRAILALRSYEMAKRVGDREALFQAACFGVLSTLPPAQFIPPMVTVLRDVMTEPRVGVSSRTLGLFLSRAGLASLACGDRASFEEKLVALEDLAGRANDTFVQGDVVLGQVVKATLDGNLQEALELFRTKTPSSPQTHLMTLITIGRINLWLGRFREVVADFDAVPAFWSSPSSPVMFEACAIAYLAAAGMASEARARLSTWAARQPLEEMNLNWQLWTLEAAVLLRDLELARRLSRELRDVAHLSGGSHVSPMPPGRLLGDTATLFEQPDEARSFYEIALQAAEKIACRPDIALARLSLGDLLLKHYPAERPSAFEHLDFAIAELEAMGMQPSLDRALRLRGRRRPVGPAKTAYPDGLSEREVEVLRLIASGNSNREIAGALFLSVRTVERHIANVYAKTGVRTKAQATSYADRHILR